MFLSFLRAESGAITVDWTVMTAAAVGLGLTSTAAVRSGVVSLGSDINTSLSGASVASMGRLGGIGNSVLASFGFDNGVPRGFSHSVTTQVGGGYGTILGPFGGAESRSNPVTFDAEFPPGTGTGIMEFDLMVLDSWDGSNNQWSSGDGDSIVMQINGQQVAVETFMFAGHPASSSFPGRTADRSSTVEVGGSTYNITMSQEYEGRLTGTSGWPDQVWRVRVEADNPPPTMRVGLSSGVNQGVSDESFGMDNVRLSTR